MNIKLLKRFRKEFNDSLIIKLSLSKIYSYVNLKTPLFDMSLKGYILDAINDAIRDNCDTPQSIKDYVYEHGDDLYWISYRDFMSSKINEYKKLYPYKFGKLSIKVKKTKRR